MVKTTLLDAVEVAGASTVTFTVGDNFITVIAENLTEYDEVRIEKQNIAEDDYLPYAPEGEDIYLTSKRPEINILGKGVYRVNVIDTPKVAISVVSVE